MNRPRLIRGLGIAWIAWWGILCVLLVVLWVRSHKYHDTVMGSVLGDQMVVVISQPGCIAFFIYSQFKTEWRHLEQKANPQEVKLVDGLTSTPVDVYRLILGVVIGCWIGGDSSSADPPSPPTNT